ncbi:MAG: hypothetical protein PHO56_05050 [Patescibacteria group bacterium]|nr:hypothetical protein [Patescibacteria group bacterium]
MKVKKIRNTRYEIRDTIISNHSGVTLLELSVSVALFSLTIILAAGIFETVINSQRIAVVSENLQENVRYDFERMGKEIRTAQRDAGHTCIPSGNIYWTNVSGTQLQFLNYHRQCVCYYLAGSQLMVASGGCNIGAPVNPLPLTPQELNISKTVFKITDSATKVQAAVSVRMHFSVSVKGSTAEQIDMETSLSSRSYQ